MNITRKMSPYQIKVAIVQLVGELALMGHECRISDVALFFGCTKATAKKHLDKAEWAYAITKKEHEYRKPTEANPKGATMYTYSLYEHGQRIFNSAMAKKAKQTVMEMKGILE